MHRDILVTIILVVTLYVLGVVWGTMHPLWDEQDPLPPQTQATPCST